MNDLWTQALSISLVAAGLLAELNLLRIFLRDWRRCTLAQKRRSLRARSRAANSATTSRIRIERSCHPMLATLAVFAAASFASAQFDPPTSLSLTPQPAEVPVAASRPLAISADLGFGLNEEADNAFAGVGINFLF